MLICPEVFGGVQLEILLISNRVTLSAAKKLRDYQRSSFSIISASLTTSILVLFSVITFALIDVAVYKMDEAQFGFQRTPSFFMFVYYSANRLVFSSIPELYPAGTLSYSISMVQIAFSLFITLIFVSIIMSFKTQSNNAQIDDTIHNIEESGRAFEETLRNRYAITTVDDAIRELERLQSGALKLILALSEYIK